MWEISMENLIYFLFLVFLFIFELIVLDGKKREEVLDIVVIVYIYIYIYMVVGGCILQVFYKYIFYKWSSC